MSRTTDKTSMLKFALTLRVLRFGSSTNKLLFRFVNSSSVSAWKSLKAYRKIVKYLDVVFFEHPVMLEKPFALRWPPKLILGPILFWLICVIFYIRNNFLNETSYMVDFGFSANAYVLSLLLALEFKTCGASYSYFLPRVSEGDFVERMW